MNEVSTKLYQQARRNCPGIADRSRPRSVGSATGVAVCARLRECDVHPGSNAGKGMAPHGDKSFMFAAEVLIDTRQECVLRCLPRRRDNKVVIDSLYANGVGHGVVIQYI